ncbi:MAG: hypothetical protein AAGA03_11255 [Planctomycetota bacterium]
MAFSKRIVLTALAVCFSLGMALPTDAAWYRKTYKRSYTRSTPRPATGYGANLHRTFVLKQELRRAKQGKTVRNRGNILWRR